MTQKQSDNYKFLIILAYQQDFIDKQILDQCRAVTGNAPDKPRAVIEFLNRGHLNKAQFKRLLELYKIFLTPREDSRFGELAVALRYLRPKAVGAALAKQKELLDTKGKKIKIGDILVSSRLLTGKQRTLVLLKQQRDASIKWETPKPKPKPVPMKEIPGEGITLLIQEDGVKAFIRKRADTDLPEAGDVIRFLDAQGITYGLADEQKIAGFLASESDPHRKFQVAQGIPVQESRDAYIEYLFENEYLMSGSEKEDGSIDFRDRGELPMVPVGEMLARKHPLSEGESGVNIFGDTIDPLPARDLALRAGDGARLSDDETAVYAAEKGFPKKDMTGCVSVVQEYHINGDVGYGTGHIEFDGDVVVSGTVQPGFKVNCHSLRADAVEGGLITCEGDVAIRKGILESKIFTRGNLFATFINQSEITCLGNVNVFGEILDSGIMAFGTCNVEKGRILSSDIAAREGVRVLDVGSKGARNTTITAGVSTYAERELKRVEEMAKTNQENLELRTEDKSAIEISGQGLDTWEQVMRDLAKNLASMIQDLEKEEALTPVKQTLLDTHKQNLEAIQQQLDAHQETTDTLERMTQEVQEELATISKANTDIVHEMMTLKQINTDNTCTPSIAILGRVQSGTKLCGVHSDTTVKKSISRVKVKEHKRFSESRNAEVWELLLLSLK